MSRNDQIPVRSQSICGIVEEIDNKELVLPEFQRDFVWKIEQTLDLFDSLVKKIHIGSLIYGTPKFEIAYRDIDTHGRNEKKNSKQYREAEEKRLHTLTTEEIKRANEMGEPCKLVLDGQQRITSMYRAVKGIDEIWFIPKDDEELLLNCNEEKRSLEELLDHFSEHQDERVLSIKLSDVFLNINAHEPRQLELFAQSKFAQSLTDESQKKAYFNIYIDLFQKIRDLLNEGSLVSYFLLNMNMDKFVLFFERSNSKAVALNFIDILVAKIYTGFKLRDKVREFNNNHEYELIPEIPVRAIAYLVSGNCGVHDIDKNFVLQKLTANDFKIYWEDVTKAYENVVEYLRKNWYIYTLKDLPYSNMLLTLTLVAYYQENKTLDSLNQEQAKFIDWWYWSVSFSKHYTSASNEAIILDTLCLNAVFGMTETEPRIDKFLSELTNPRFKSTADVSELVVSRNPIYFGIMGLLRRENKGIINWMNGEMLASADVDSHHIFPQKYLANQKIDTDLIDRVANRVIISKITNIQIGKKSPSVYLSVLKKSNSKLEDCLEKCCTPSPDKLISGYYDDKYEEFLKERSEKLFSLICEKVRDHDEWAREYAKKTLSSNL